jgi:outer membrane protein, heavy metal efflux system
MRTRLILLTGACLGLLPLGCATVDPSADYARAQDQVRAATGAVDLYLPGAEQAAQAKVAELLVDGLSSPEAVQVALLNNRALQTALLRIGIARAEAVQAGLLSNPSLGVAVRFSTGGGNTNTEASFVQNLIELWQLPARKRAAEGQLERTVLEVAHLAASLAAETKAAYAAAVAGQEAHSVAEENLESARTFLELTLERQTAGAATEVDVNVARSELLGQRVQVRTSRYMAFETRRLLALRLGLESAPGDLELTDPLAGPVDTPFDVEQLITRARRHRLDLRAAARSTEAAEAALELERRLFLRTIEAGLALESQGGDHDIGPEVQLQLPIFDQNQAQIAKAEYRLAQARRTLEGQSALVVQEVRGAHARYSLARDTVRLYQEELLPLRRTSLDLAREAFAAGKTGFLSVLEVQQQLLTARREAVDQLESLLRSVPELEAACGQPLEALLAPEVER